jgi:hypothetical protein
MLNRYAHQFTLLKGGCDAELTRINHYLVGAGLPPLRREAVVSDRRNQATSESAYSGHLSAVSGRQHSRHTPASAESA